MYSFVYSGAEQGKFMIVEGEGGLRCSVLEIIKWDAIVDQWGAQTDITCECLDTQLTKQSVRGNTILKSLPTKPGSLAVQSSFPFSVSQ